MKAQTSGKTFDLREVFQDPTAPMQKALQSAIASGSSLMAMALSQLSDGKTQPDAWW